MPSQKTKKAKPAKSRKPSKKQQSLESARRDAVNRSTRIVASGAILHSELKKLGSPKETLDRVMFHSLVSGIAELLFPFLPPLKANKKTEAKPKPKTVKAKPSVKSKN